MVGAWLGEWATVKVAEALLGGVSCKLNAKDLDKALKEATKAAQAQENELFLQGHGLFFRCEPDVVRKFIEQFFKGSGVEELQKPLKKQGTPHVDFLVAAFKQAAEENSRMRGKIDESLVKPWMEVFVRTYFKQTNTYLEFQFIKEKYFKQLENYFDDVKFAGIAVEGQEVDFKSEKLDQIFVMLDVVEDVRTRPDRQLEQDFLLEGTNSRQAQLIREQQQRVMLENRSGKKISAEQLLSQNQLQKVVLLGAPGSGKTTLMSYFAVMLAQKHPEKLGLAVDTDWLPILIRIRDLARQPNLNILDYARQFANNTLCVNPPLPLGFFESWLEDGRALILLDGLDEVPEEGKRDEVVRYIENFLGQFERNRAIITSRPAGYRRDFFRTDEFPHYEVQPFDDPKIEEFINRWYDSRVKEDKPEAERCKDSLRKALSDNARIKLLARNPLLLTIITLIHRYRAILPKQRHELYDKAVETLLKSWDAKRELSHHKVLKYLELDDLRRLMESVAYWIHTQASTGDKESGTLIDRNELIEQLSREIRALKQVKPYEAKEEAKRFVNFIRERTGLLNEQGQDCYAFVHKTFQEYLCAQEIIYRADNEDDFDIILNHIRKHLHNAHWREVLLLLIAQQKPKKAARAIRTILSNGSEYEQWLHRDLLFAGSCLAENPKGLKGAANGLAEEILEQLVEFEVDKSGRVGERIRQQIFQTFCSLYETDFEAQTLHLLKNGIPDTDKVRLQGYRAVLGEKEKAIEVLLVLLQDKDSSIRSRAASVLGWVGKSSDLALQGVLAQLHDENRDVRRRVAEALGELGNASDLVLQTLLERSLHEGSWPSGAARSLVKLNRVSEVLLQGLFGLLQDEELFVCENAAYVLCKLEQASEEVSTRLLARLEDEDAEVRYRIVSTLGQLGNASEPVLQGFLARLQDEDRHVRRAAVYGLSKLGNSSETVIQKLLEQLRHEDSETRLWVAFSLGKLGSSLDKVPRDMVASDLLTLLHDDNSKVRVWAVEALGKLGCKSETVVSTIFGLLHHEDSEVRSNAVDALVMLDNTSDALVNTLLALLQDGNLQVRSDAVSSLGKLGNTSETVVSALLEQLQNEQSSTHYRTVRALGNLGKKSSDFVTAVTQWISLHQDSEYVGNGIDALWDMVVGEQS